MKEDQHDKEVTESLPEAAGPGQPISDTGIGHAFLTHSLKLPVRHAECSASSNYAYRSLRFKEELDHIEEQQTRPS